MMEEDGSSLVVQKTFDSSDYFILVLVCQESNEVCLSPLSGGGEAGRDGRDEGEEDDGQEEDNLPFLPFVKADRASGSWKVSAEELVKQVFAEVDVATSSSLVEKVQLIRISRFWYPVTVKDSVFLQRFHLYLPLSAEERHRIKTQDSQKWVELKSLLSKGSFDPERAEILRKVMIPEVSAKPPFTFREYGQDAFLMDPSQKNVAEAKKLQALLTKAAGVQIDDQKRLYREFLSLTFPSLFISFKQFQKLMLNLGWETTDLKDLFRSFNTRRTHSGEPPTANFLSFSEVLCGLCASEPHTPHGDEAGETRCRYIFRFFSRVHGCKLTFDEFCSMVREIRRAKGYSVDANDVENEARASSKVFGCEENHSLTLNDFLTGVGQLKFRGTSNLLRSPESAFSLLRAQEEGRQLQAPSSASSSSSSLARRGKRLRPQPEDPTLLSFESVYEEDDEDNKASFLNNISNNLELPSTSITSAEYDFATHVIKVKRSGQVKWDSLWEIPEAVTNSSSFTNSQRSNFGRLQSIRAFSITSEANEMLTGLRYFERPSKNSIPEKMALTWGKVDVATFGRSLMDLCQQARGLLIQEPRLVKLKSPTYILGDLHGNFRDLVCFEKVLWRMGAKLTPANFLFLGDYVDRGEFGVEVVAYLFAQKVAAPTKFHLLRGNHECRQIQKNFTFHTECITKFGKDLGAQVWEEINQVFDVMPCAAVIDGKIFCVHGGIPPPWLGEGQISALDKINKDIPDPEKEELIWNLLWNDPVSSENKEKLQMLPQNKGFVENWRRGTGHMFSDSALDDFLTRNGLSHVIRAHEVKQAGFQVQHHQKLLTVFSSSKYCNGVNEAACVLADNHKLRLIRLDTS